MKSLLLLLIRGYQIFLSPALRAIVGPTGGCRFEPSCSCYAHEAIATHGVLQGSWLSVKRLARCHPFGGAGFDPVPPRMMGARSQTLKHTNTANHRG